MVKITQVMDLINLYICVKLGQDKHLSINTDPPGPEINVVHNRNTVVNCVTLLGPFIISINKNGSFIMQKLIFSPIYMTPSEKVIELCILAE